MSDQRRALDPREAARFRPASRAWAAGLVLGAGLAGCGVPAADADANASAGAQSEATAPQAVVRPGIEVLLSDSIHLVRGLRVGLITNHTGRDRNGRSSIDLLAEHPDVRLVALYSPEHGIRGDEEAGARIEGGLDERTGLPVHSLYGPTLKPTGEMLEGIDLLLFDMQDIGARYYTYVSTMALAMEAAGEQGLPFLVLDRPNPIRGDVVQGNVLDPAFSTFVGRYAVPMRHGMTAGELALLYRAEFGVGVDVRVVPADGWTRAMAFDETGLPWVPPSPNIPALESALAYPGTCLFEGTPLSVGRGSERAFQWVGAPWLDGEALASALNGYAIPGVRFEATSFTPRSPGDGKFADTEVHGVRLVISSSDFDAPRAAVAMLIEARRMSGDRWSWNVSHFDRLAGTNELREGIDAELGLEALVAGWAGERAAFVARREAYLIYR